MIISKTPMRISLAGGSSDFEEFYKKEGGGVLSSTISKYIYVIVNPSFEDRIHISYSKKENVRTADKVKHDLVREAMRKVGVRDKVEITTISDVPSEGTGLGSSSALTVGLLNALYRYTGQEVNRDPSFPTREQLAEEAYDIEANVLGRPIGKQDQYAAAFGGLRIYNFHKNGSVSSETLRTNPRRKQEVSKELLLFYTGITRQSGDILAEQKKNIPDKLEYIRTIRDMVMPMKAALLEGPRWKVGEYLHAGWYNKKQLAECISSPEIDTMYIRARDAGATGGKITGAGGGGFLLLHVPIDKQEAVRAAMKGKIELELEFDFTDKGSEVIYCE